MFYFPMLPKPLKAIFHESTEFEKRPLSVNMENVSNAQFL